MTTIRSSPTEPGSVSTSRRDRVFRGSAFTFGAYVAGSVLRLVSNLILAKLLFPEAFALVALAGIVTQGLKMFSEIGIGPSIIRSTRVDGAFLNTAWTVQVLRGWGLFFAACLLAVPFASFYEMPVLLWIIPASAFPSAVSGFNSTSLFTQNRQLHLGMITAIGLSESIVKLIVTLVWAIFDPSVWALLGGVIVSRIWYTITTHIALPPRPHRFQWERRAFGELVAFGFWIFLSTAVTFFAGQSDRLLLGKLIPLDLLGVYSISYMFSRLPLEVCTAVASSVLFPALASIARERPERLRETMTRIRRVLLTLGAAGTIGLMVTAPWFFHFAYDERYAAAVWLAPIMALVAWFSLLQAATDRVLLAIGDTRSMFVSNLLNFIVTVAGGLYAFHLFGIIGFIAAYGAGNVVGHMIIVIAAARRGLLTIRQDVAYTAIVLVAAIVGCWWPAAWSMDVRTNEGLLRLVAQSVVAVVATSTAAYVLWRAVLRR